MTDKEQVNLEIVMALELLEYHDRNYLSRKMANPNKCSREKTLLLQEIWPKLNDE